MACAAPPSSSAVYNPDPRAVTGVRKLAVCGYDKPDLTVSTEQSAGAACGCYFNEEGVPY